MTYQVTGSLRSEGQEDTIKHIQHIVPEHVVKILKRIFPVLIPFVKELFFYMPEGEKCKEIHPYKLQE
jgi:hypothetical protein